MCYNKKPVHSSTNPLYSRALKQTLSHHLRSDKNRFRVLSQCIHRLLDFSPSSILTSIRKAKLQCLASSYTKCRCRFPKNLRKRFLSRLFNPRLLLRVLFSISKGVGYDRSSIILLSLF